MSKILSLSFFACPTDATHCWEGAVTIASLYAFCLLTDPAPFGHNTNAGHVWGYLRHTPSAISGLSITFCFTALLRQPRDAMSFIFGTRGVSGLSYEP